MNLKISYSIKTFKSQILVVNNPATESIRPKSKTIAVAYFLFNIPEIS